MSSTRRVESGERRTQNGWASAPEFDVLRGLNGTAVAFKAALLDDPKKRELLYFLQALSLRDGGAKRIARELVEMFPERICTPTMKKIGCKPGKRITMEQSEDIAGELWPHSDTESLFEAISNKPKTEVVRHLHTAEFFLAECNERAGRLDVFIEELCCNPKMAVSPHFGDEAAAYRANISRTLDDYVGSLDFKCADVIYFADVLGALFEYQQRYIARARADFVETSIGKIVFEAMDYVLETKRSALIEGISGFGKTTALKAWCDMHPGLARYVQLSGITTRTTFFRKLAKALGVASGAGMSPSKVQTRVEDFLQRTKLMLVIDEGMYLWPQGKRIESHPELMNWLNTSCYNEGVPFAISATKQFTLRRQAVEKSTDWSSEQSRRRTRRTFQLPDAPADGDTKALARMKTDLILVARKLLGDLGEVGVEYVAGYALTSKGYFQAITDAVDDARLIAKRAGRERFTLRDLKTAIHDWRMPSDAALQRVFDSKPEGRRRRRQEMPPGPDLETAHNESLTRDLEPVKDRLSGGLGAARTPRTELVAVSDG